MRPFELQRTEMGGGAPGAGAPYTGQVEPRDKTVSEDRDYVRISVQPSTREAVTLGVNDEDELRLKAWVFNIVDKAVGGEVIKDQWIQVAWLRGKSPEEAALSRIIGACVREGESWTGDRSLGATLTDNAAEPSLAPWQYLPIAYDVVESAEVDLHDFISRFPQDGTKAVTHIDSWASKKQSRSEGAYLYADYDPERRAWTRLISHRALESRLKPLLNELDLAIERAGIRDRLIAALAPYGARLVRVEVMNYSKGSRDTPKLDAFLHNLVLAFTLLCEQGWPNPSVSDYEKDTPLAAQLTALVQSNRIDCDTSVLPLSERWMEERAVDSANVRHLLKGRDDLHQVASATSPRLALTNRVNKKLRKEFVRRIEAAIDAVGKEKVREALSYYGTGMLRCDFEYPEITEFWSINGIDEFLKSKFEIFLQHCADRWVDPTEWVSMFPESAVYDGGAARPIARAVVSLIPHTKLWQPSAVPVPLHQVMYVVNPDATCEVIDLTEKRYEVGSRAVLQEAERWKGKLLSIAHAYLLRRHLLVSCSAVNDLSRQTLENLISSAGLGDTDEESNDKQTIRVKFFGDPSDVKAAIRRPEGVAIATAKNHPILVVPIGESKPALGLLEGLVANHFESLRKASPKEYANLYTLLDTIGPLLLLPQSNEVVDENDLRNEIKALDTPESWQQPTTGHLKLRKVADSWHREWVQKIIDRHVTDDEPSLPKLDPMEAIKDLARKLIDQQWDDADIKKLGRTIAEARNEPPNDKKHFVRLVNFVLDSTRHRISFTEPNGKQTTTRLARLCVNPGKGADIIQFELGGGAGSRGGFSTDPSKSVSVVPYKYGDARVNRS